MPQIEVSGIDIEQMPPYDRRLTCPKCGAGLRLVPGDRYVVEVAPDQQYGEVIFSCPRCQNEVACEVPDASAMLESVIQLPYREYLSLRQQADQARHIERMMVAYDRLDESLAWIERQFDAIDVALRPAAPPARVRRDETYDQDDRPVLRRRRDEIDDDETRRRPDRDRPRYGPRGAEDREKELGLMGGTISVGGSGRRGSSVDLTNEPPDDEG